jgi:type I restriction enzyme R subunit
LANPFINLSPEQQARLRIDAMLDASGWVIQNKGKHNIAAAPGVAIREYPTDAGPADYVLFVDRKPVGVIEAKREEEGIHLTIVEDQALSYAQAKLKRLNNSALPFVYESTGQVTDFTDYRDPKPRARRVFTFHRPETLSKWLKEDKTLRARLHDIPALSPEGLRECQVQAITNLEKSFREGRPKALVQMATGSGKTFTAITAIYRLLKFAKVKRVLFLVDTKNLGEQAEQEFKLYKPQDDNRLFTELYGVTRLTSSYIPGDSQVYISTIQRLYSILKGDELDERDEEESPESKGWSKRDPMPVVYNKQVPPEFFDFIIIDECHRSIYNLWKQVLDYFDAFQIGLTATPDNRTFGYFEQNLVCDYGYKRAVEDGVLVPYNVFEIGTKVTKEGGLLPMNERVDTRNKLTRKEFWLQLDEDVAYTGKQLDDKVVNPSTIHLIARTVREHLPVMFPDRIGADESFEVPKTLIFAKSDSHADDIIRIFRKEFGEENKFCKKITYRSEEDPKSVLQQFRNEYYPRIAVTVDMIATGTDIRPLEVLLFMRDVKSRSYYEQMKGRGTRTCSLEELRATGTPAAKFTKDHFVIIDAIGVEGSRKTDSRPLERKPGLSLKEVLEGVHMGATDEDMLTTLANRLIMLDKRMNERERAGFTEKTGLTIPQVVKRLLDAHDPDTLEGLMQNAKGKMQNADEAEAAFKEAHEALIREATAPFDDYEVRDYLVEVKRMQDQIIDHLNRDEIVSVGWVKNTEEAARATVDEFRAWMEAHKEEITALQIFYSQPYGRRSITYKMIRELAEAIKRNKPGLAPMAVWQAYEKLEKVAGSPRGELSALVSLLRRITGPDTVLTAWDKSVDKAFQDWVFRQQAGALKYTEEQMAWLRMIKDYVAASFHIEGEDFELAPFNAAGGLGKMWQLFGERTDAIIEELNRELAA